MYKNFRIAELLLKKGASSGLTLYEIGDILYRMDENIPAQIE